MAVWPIVIGATVGFGWAAVGGYLYRRYRSHSPSFEAGFHPKNMSPWERLYRLRRADNGKSDPWFARTTDSGTGRLPQRIEGTPKGMY